MRINFIRQSRLFILFIGVFLVLFIFACNQSSTEYAENDSGGSTEVGNPVHGLAQKGPFAINSDVDINELYADTLQPNGNHHPTKTRGWLGSFPNTGIISTNDSSLIEVKVSGRFFNEVAGEEEQYAEQEFIALADMRSTENVNVNILTTLAVYRIRYLVTTAGMSFGDAVAQAEEEVLRIFNIPQPYIDEVVDTGFVNISISEDNDPSAILLAVSAVMLGEKENEDDNAGYQLEIFSTEIAYDIEEDGVLSPKWSDELRKHAMALDLTDIRENLRKYYGSHDLSVPIPPFEDFVDSDGDTIINREDYILLAPISGENINNTLPLLDWTDSGLPNALYRVQLTTDPQFDTFDTFAWRDASEFQITSELVRGEIYYWRVQIQGDNVLPADNAFWAESEYFYVSKLIHVDDLVDPAFEDGSSEFPYNTIQEGIDATDDGDVVLAADGIYTGEIDEFQRNKNLEFRGKAITVISENGPETCVIDCEGAGRGVSFGEGEGRNSVFSGFTIMNGLADYGGAINIWGIVSPTIENCIIRGNEATEQGGGIYVYHRSAPLIINCVIADNVSQNYGGGITTHKANPEINHCTIANNSTTEQLYSAGICSLTESSTFGGSVKNSIVWGNSPQDAAHITGIDVSGDITSEGREKSLPAYIKNSCVNDDFSNIFYENGAPASIINIDPEFENPANGNYRLQSTSPCIDTGGYIDVYPNDIDGNIRPQGKGYDLGAYEYSGPGQTTDMSSLFADFGYAAGLQKYDVLTHTWTKIDGPAPDYGEINPQIMLAHNNELFLNTGPDECYLYDGSAYQQIIGPGGIENAISWNDMLIFDTGDGGMVTYDDLVIHDFVTIPGAQDGLFTNPEGFGTWNDFLLGDFGSSGGLWFYNGLIWEELTKENGAILDAELMADWNGTLAVYTNEPGVSMYTYDGSPNLEEEYTNMFMTKAVTVWKGNLMGSANCTGLVCLTPSWHLDGFNSPTGNCFPSPAPENLYSWDSMLVADYGDGINDCPGCNDNPTYPEIDDDFDDVDGLWLYDGADWLQISPYDAENVVTITFTD